MWSAASSPHHGVDLGVGIVDQLPGGGCGVTKFPSGLKIGTEAGRLVFV
jgi:hypothetical protein